MSDIYTRGQRARGLGFMWNEPGISRKTTSELGRDIRDAFLSLLFASCKPIVSVLFVIRQTAHVEYLM